ncbi:hypothetical protein PESHB4_01560 [Pediococcus ethanolidurans]
MKNLKKVVLLFTLSFLTISLAGCGKQNTSKSSTEKTTSSKKLKPLKKLLRKPLL